MITNDLYSFIEDKIDVYKTRTFLLKENDQKDDEQDDLLDDSAPSDTKNDDVPMDDSIPQDDPTMTPEDEDSTGLPANDNGVKVSDASFAMYANLLLKAFLLQPSPEEIKEINKDRVVDESNAEQVIKDIENIMTKRDRQQSTQNSLTNTLEKY